MLGGKTTPPLPGTFNSKCLELLGVRPGCGAPGASQGFITPFHVIPSFSNPWKKSSGRAGGEGNPLLFDLQVLLHSSKASAALTQEHRTLPAFLPGALLLPTSSFARLEEVNIFPLTRQEDLLPLCSVPVLHLRELDGSCSSTSDRSLLQSKVLGGGKAVLGQQQDF